MNSTEPEPETPTTEDVRDSYTVAWAGWDTTMQYDPKAYAEFDRWLAQHSARIWDEGFAAGAKSEEDAYWQPGAPPEPANPYREGSPS